MKYYTVELFIKDYHVIDFKEKKQASGVVTEKHLFHRNKSEYCRNVEDEKKTERGKHYGKSGLFLWGKSEQYRFYQIPAILLEDEEYKKISDTAKLLYGILLSRLALSKKITD